MQKNKKIRVAVIGAGNMGKNHIRNYSLINGVELIAVADISPKTKRLAADYRIKHYTDYKYMLDEMMPEAVSIVVPTPFHAEVATECIRRGIHCLLEKPIASSVKEAEQLIELAKNKNIIFTIGHIEHYNPLVIKLKEMVVDKRMIGKITSIVCKRVGGFPAVEPRTDVIIDLAVHDIGIISFLLDKQPKHIYSHASKTHHSEKVDSAEILLDYGQASGFIQANWLTPVKIRTISVTGSKGYIEGNYITQELVHYENNMEKLEDGFSNFVIKMGDPKKQIIKIDFIEPLSIELNAFISNIQGNHSVKLVSPVDAKNALNLALEAVKIYEK